MLNLLMMRFECLDCPRALTEYLRHRGSSYIHLLRDESSRAPLSMSINTPSSPLRCSMMCVTPLIAAVLAAGVLTACKSRSSLWESSLNDMEAKIDRKVARTAAAPMSQLSNDETREGDDPNSLVARLNELERASDEEQARMIARGIDAAVQLESAKDPEASSTETRTETPQNTAVPATREFVLGISRVWHLAEIVAVALEANPETREAWQLARAAAAREQSALAAYAPDMGVRAGASLTTAPGLSNSPSKSMIDTEFRAAPQIYLTWVLLDFGRRDAVTDRTRAELAAANLTHDRSIQRVLYAVERNYFALEATIGLRTAALQDVASARSVLEATEERLVLGLATRPEALIARQSYAEALYQLEKSRADVFVAEGELRRSAGFPANLPIPIDATPEGELPPALAVGVDGIIDMALTQRPDLAAAVLELRAREADIRRAEASFMPQVDFAGAVGPGFYDFDVEGLSLDGSGWELQGNVLLGGSWLLYDGGARDAALAEVHAKRSVAAARLAALRLDAENQVWRAYFELQSNRAQYDAAKALVLAATDSFDAVRESYQLGLSTLPEMLDSERDLFEARAQRIQSRADFLTSSAQLVFACGAGAGEVVSASSVDAQR